ncbi:MAG: cyclase family protein [Nitrospiraceae bacterium]
MKRHSLSRLLSLWFGIFVFLLCAACGPPRPYTLVDLTHSFGDETVYWPTNRSFQRERTDWGTTATGYWYASADFSASEHGGTHMDAPLHFAQNGISLDQIPVERLTGPAIVIDMRAQCEANADYALTVQDVLAWEGRYGEIPRGALVFLWSGWDRRWPNKDRYLGTETPDDPRTLHFPGLSPEAAELLIAQRNIHGVGIDTASIDPGRSQDFLTHRLLSAAGVYALENVVALDRVPSTGATIWALPMKIAGGTGGPVRIIAVLPD